MSDVSINIPHLGLEHSSDHINKVFIDLVPVRDKMSVLLLSFNFVVDESSRSIKNYQTEMAAIVEWQKLLQHYEPQINNMVKSLQGFRILLKNELETDEANIRTDPKLVNALGVGQMTHVVRSRTAEDRKKMAMLNSHLSVWEAVLDNYLKKSRNLQLQYTNIDKMLRVMERTGELDADPYEIIKESSEHLTENIKDLEEKCLPGVNDIDLLSGQGNNDRDVKNPEEASPAGEKNSLEDLFDNLEK